MWRQQISKLTAKSQWKKVAKASVVSVMVPKIPMCMGTLLTKQGDDFETCSKVVRHGFRIEISERMDLGGLFRAGF